MPRTGKNHQIVHVDMDEKDGVAELINDTVLLVKGGVNEVDRHIKFAGNNLVTDETNELDRRSEANDDMRQYDRAIATEPPMKRRRKQYKQESVT